MTGIPFPKCFKRRNEIIKFMVLANGLQAMLVPLQRPNPFNLREHNVSAHGAKVVVIRGLPNVKQRCSNSICNGHIKL